MKPPAEDLSRVPQDDSGSGPPDDNRLILLIPDGAYTYRLVALADVRTAAAYVDAHLVPGQSFLAFWALDACDGVDRSNPGEALVMVRDESRPDVVRPYSFTDLESASCFLEREFGPERDTDRILFVWAEPVSVPRGLTPPASILAPARQAPVLHYPSSTPIREAGPLSTPVSTEQALLTASTSGPPAVHSRSPGFFSRMAAWPGWNGLGPLMVSAALGQRQTYYEALDSDEYAGGRAGLIVTLGAISAAAGALGLGPFAPFWHFAGAILGWSLAVAVIYATAVMLVRGKLPPNCRRRMLIALGFAYSPAALLMLGIVPVFGPLFVIGILIWLGVTTVVAVITALEMEEETAVITAFAGWIPLFALTLIAPQLIA
jgi:hypothetical protein